MLKDLRHHGSIGNIDFFTFVAGENIYSTYFYEEDPRKIRYFYRGNEFSIEEDGIAYKGTGGSFCEYMFGVEKPLKDMVKGDVLNRLIMFGAYTADNEQVVFTNDTEGIDTFYRLFLQGHAVTNYFFLVASGFQGDYKERQKHILRSVGKTLKRTELTDQRDTLILSRFSEALEEERAVIFLFKLIHRGNKEYYDAFRDFYSRRRELTYDEDMFLEEIASRNEIDQYQQERMKIDVMYRHPENKLIVDEYRDVLLKGLLQDSFHASEHARMNRLRKLSIRNNIPVVLFDTLDSLLLKDRSLQEVEEQEYVREARAILETLFFKDISVKKHIINDDVVRLIRAKHLAHSQNDKGFELVLLDIGKMCDELSRERDDLSLFEEFSSIVTYFDRYDTVQALLSQLSFMENVELKEESLRSLVGNKRAFDELDPDLFRTILIKDLMENKYVTYYGKRKLELVVSGIENIQNGESSYREVITALRSLSEEERLYHEVHKSLKERMRGFFPGMNVKEAKRQMREEISTDLSARKGILVRLPAKLFEKVFMDLRKESVYLNQILPSVIQTSDPSLREDFLDNSGLDRFYIESLELEYFEEKGLDTALLDAIRERRVLSDAGGGERI